MKRLYAQPHQIHQHAQRSAATGLIVSLCFLAALSVVPSLAHATAPSLAGGQTIGQIATNINTSLRGASLVITALAYLGALVFGYIGAMKFKAHGEQPDRTPFKVPVTYWGIAAVLAALPEFIGTGVVSIWNQGARTVPVI